MIKIRKYKESDYNNLVLCMEKLQDYIVMIDPLNLNIRTKGYGDKYTKLLLKKIEEKNGIIYLLFDNDIIIGCIAGIFGFPDEDSAYEFKNIKIGEILELYIDENYRGKKLGQKLMKTIEEYFKKNKCEYFYVDVFTSNKNAYNFYEKMGYHSRMQTMIKKIN